MIVLHHSIQSYLNESQLCYTLLSMEIAAIVFTAECVNADCVYWYIYYNKHVYVYEALHPHLLKLKLT